MKKKLKLTFTTICELAFLFESHLNREHTFTTTDIQKYLDNRKEIDPNLKSKRSKFEKFLKGLYPKKFGTFKFFEYEQKKEYSLSEGIFIIMLCLIKDLPSFKSLDSCKPFNPKRIERDKIKEIINSITSPETLDGMDSHLTHDLNLAFREFPEQYENLIVTFNSNWKDTLDDIVNVLAELSTYDSKRLLNDLRNIEFKQNISIKYFVEALNSSNFEN